MDPADIQADITPLPSLAAGVDARVRTFSVGLDPNLEQTAAEWFESLGYRTLTGDVKYTKGYWGGTKAEADPRLGASFCAGAADLSPVEDYDFANWLPVPNLMDDIASAYPDAKFILFESDSARWLDNVYIKAQEAALKGHKCGCGGDVEDRVASAKCALGDGHHFCDLYPCVYERTFATTAVDPETVGRDVRQPRQAGQVQPRVPAAGGGHELRGPIPDRGFETDRGASRDVRGSKRVRPGAPIRAARAGARERAQVAGVLVRVRGRAGRGDSVRAVAVHRRRGSVLPRHVRDGRTEVKS